MGTICAPTYANIFVSEFEERYNYPLIKNKFSSYLRFIDNTFMVWTKSENKLKSFINEINKKHHSIKFDVKFLKEKIGFLDTLVYIDYNNRLQTTLLKKHSNNLVKRFVEKGYKENIIRNQIEKVDNLERSTLLNKN